MINEYRIYGNVNAISIVNFLPRVDPELLYCHPLPIHINIKVYRSAILSVVLGALNFGLIHLRQENATRVFECKTVEEIEYWQDLIDCKELGSSWLYCGVYIRVIDQGECRSHWSRGLRRRSTAGRMLRLWVRIPPGVWMDVCFECCMLSGRGLSNELITRPEVSFRLWCVVVCDLETSWMRMHWPSGGCCAKYNKEEWDVLYM